MQRKTVYAATLILTFALTLVMKPSSAATLSPSDFKLQSFSKTVDFFDYVRQYAASQGMVPPVNASWHAYLYQTYINMSGFQLFYNGLINITAGQGALTIPVQNFLEHYKTPNGKDVLVSSSFVMMLAFNDTATSKHADSPDVNDNLYASFSLGFDITNITGSSIAPLSSKTTVIPLETTDDKTWTWGMRYTNLTAIWWTMFINPLNPRFEPLTPIAITTYDELTFTYKLELNPTNHKAEVTTNYVIGRMTNLWLIYWPFRPLPILPIVFHFNSTGEYWPNGAKISNTNIHQFLEQQHIKMSIVLFQNSLVLNQKTNSVSNNNQNVTDAEVDVSNGSISTQAGNEEIFKADFGTKKQYKLYNYTAESTESTYDTYDAVTRTAPRAGFARNHLFDIHVAFLKYIPLIVANIDPPLFQKAKERLLSMEYADYFYLISYPEYSGFKVVHDPTFTAYIATPGATSGPAGFFGLILIGGIIAVAVIGAVFIVRRRGPKTRSVVQPPMPPATT